ncbi:C4-dicarboxylate TRAP transporter substrate-binding protein [Acidimangrovimonas sediminis]|uniref:C4-dicarboxylate TRAP transporter substrate-binding protein n=1 Tax=Acidimangrovimonas sediminis TaxID=2056283 RepID=UPI0013049A64|nr:C4-dicarboxylate TRAP transporter substrate-binding protein [Acidimangrovimonas sediminis]
MKKAIRRMLCVTALTALAAGAASADTLSYASGWPSSSAATGAFESYAKVIDAATDGKLKMKVYSLSLLNFAEANSGLKEGMADAATILTPYFAAEFPRLNMMAEATPMMELDGFASPKSFMAFAGAMSEFVMLHCPACQKEVAGQNQVFMGAAVTTSYILQCMKPAATMDDLKGLRIRTAGPYWSRWVKAMAAVPVTISVNETFEALTQGVLDCTASNPTDMKNFRFIEAVKYVVPGVPGGQFPLPTMFNRDRWTGLSETERAAVMKAGATLFADMNFVYYNDGIAAMKEAKSRGIKAETPSADLAAKNQAFIDKDLKAVAGSYKEKYGLDDSDEMLTSLRGLVKKWSGLVDGVQSPDALAKVYWDEIYSKVDVKTYGS